MLPSFEHGLIGNFSSATVINPQGIIQWCCLPHLDSSSHFNTLIHPSKGGWFQISPLGPFRSQQKYLARTPILETHFETPTGTAILTDWMPAFDADIQESRLCRNLKVIQGKVQFIMVCSPRFQDGEESASVEVHTPGFLFRGKKREDVAHLHISSAIPIELKETSLSSTFEMSASQETEFLWSWGRIFKLSFPSIRKTQEFWNSIVHQCSTPCLWGGPWHEPLIRSQLLFKILSSQNFGTLSWGVIISESHRTTLHGGAWILQSLFFLDLKQEANNYFNWIRKTLLRDRAEGLQASYSLDGSKNLSDISSYRQTHQRPLTTGFQLDIYAQGILTAYQYYQIFKTLPLDLWPVLTELADYLCQAWKRPDFGTLGFTHRNALLRSPARPEHFVSSKVFCWAALDRILILSRLLNQRPPQRWSTERDIIHRTICEQGYDSNTNSFTRAFGDREMDSSCLWLLPLGFLPKDDFRIQGTFDRVNRELSRGVCLRPSTMIEELYQSNEDDLCGSFLYCTNLALADRVQEASDRIAELCT